MLIKDNMQILNKTTSKKKTKKKPGHMRTLTARKAIFIAFALLFAGVGSYLVIRSRAASSSVNGLWPASCDNRTRLIPGDGRAIGNPSVTFARVSSTSGMFSNSVIVAVRGTNPGSSVYYQALDLDNLKWSGTWLSLGGSTTGDLGVAARGNIFVSVRGSDNRSYWENAYQNGRWTGWYGLNPANRVAYPQTSTAFKYGTRTYTMAVTTGADGQIYYRCT